MKPTDRRLAATHESGSWQRGLWELTLFPFFPTVALQPQLVSSLTWQIRLYIRAPSSLPQAAILYRLLPAVPQKKRERRRREFLRSAPPPILTCRQIIFFSIHINKHIRRQLAPILPLVVEYERRRHLAPLSDTAGRASPQSPIE